MAADRPLRADAERNRRLILAAARAAFAESGLEVSMDEIARRAGVGVGTAYRRVPDKERLIEALFEQRLDELVDMAEELRSREDPWQAVSEFLERFTAAQVEDRGLRELLLSSRHAEAHVERARARLAPIGEEMVRRAQAAGELRGDVTARDLGLLHFMLGALADYTREVAPDVWRRFLGIVVDGLRTRRDAPSPLAAGPLDHEQFGAAMRAWRPG